MKPEQEMKQLFQSQSSDTIKLAFVAIDTAFQVVTKQYSFRYQFLRLEILSY